MRPSENLLEHLKSPDRWTRRFAKRVLADRPRDTVTTALKEWTSRNGLSEHALVEALGVYQSHEVVAPELLARLCRATNWNARAYAASVVGAWADRLADPLALLRPLVADENPRVRLQAVVACTYVAKPEAMEVAAIAADFPTDKFFTYALNQAVFALKPYWLAPFKAGKLNLENKPSRLSLLIRADGTPDTLNALRELVDAPTTSGSAHAKTFSRCWPKSVTRMTSRDCSTRRHFPRPPVTTLRSTRACWKHWHLRPGHATFVPPVTRPPR